MGGPVIANEGFEKARYCASIQKKKIDDAFKIGKPKARLFKMCLRLTMVCVMASVVRQVMIIERAA